MPDGNNLNRPHIAAIRDQKRMHQPELVALIEEILAPMSKSWRISELCECGFESVPHFIGCIESSGLGDVFPDIQKMSPGSFKENVAVHDAFRFRRSALRRRSSSKTSSPL